jgi:hypothetical protein
MTPGATHQTRSRKAGEVAIYLDAAMMVFNVFTGLSCAAHRLAVLTAPGWPCGAAKSAYADWDLQNPRRRVSRRLAALQARF